MPLHSQKRNTLISLSLRQSHTDYMCSSSLNDTVNAPHQRMSHSTTLLLWWFLHSMYYIMQQRVLLSYIHHNKHSPSVLIYYKYNQNHYPSRVFFVHLNKKRCFYQEQKTSTCQRVPKVSLWLKVEPCMHISLSLGFFTPSLQLSEFHMPALNLLQTLFRSIAVFIWHNHWIPCQRANMTATRGAAGSYI